MVGPLPNGNAVAVGGSIAVVELDRLDHILKACGKSSSPYQSEVGKGLSPPPA